MYFVIWYNEMMRQENMNDLDDIIITKRIRKRYKNYFEKYKDDDVKL